MYLKTLLLSMAVLYCGVVGESHAASGASHIDVITLGTPTKTLTQAPFAERISFYPDYVFEEEEETTASGDAENAYRGDVEQDDNAYDAETAICSLFVGERNSLPEGETIKFIAGNSDLHGYQEKSPRDALHLINLAQYDDLDGFVFIVRGIESFSLDMFEWDFENSPEKSHDYLAMIAASRQEINAHSDIGETFRTLFHQTLESLQEYIYMYQGQESLVSKDDQKSIILDGLEVLKSCADVEDLEKAARVKDVFLTFIQAHENTLFFIGIGSYGDNVDDLPFIRTFMEDQTILAHSILVEGRSKLGKRDPNSSFTKNYADHVIGKPYQARVYHSKRGRYGQECGTYYSSSLAVMDAYRFAQEHSLSSYSDLKKALLNAEKSTM